MLFTLLMIQFGDLLRSPKEISPDLVYDTAGLDCYVTGIITYDKDRIVLLSPKDKMIYLLNHRTKELILLADKSQGPIGLSGGFFTASFIGDKVYVLTTSKKEIVSIYPGDHKTVGYSPYLVKDFVKAGERIFAVNVAPGAKEFSFDDWVSTPESRLIGFTVTEDGWFPDTYPLSEEFMSDSSARLTFGLSTKLLLLPDGKSFYRIPSWGNPTYQIISSEGEVISVEKIPHPLSNRMPVDAKVREELYRNNRSRGKLLGGSAIDPMGNIAFLLDGLSREEGDQRVVYSKRLIVLKKGKKLASFVLESPIRSLVGSTKEGVFFAIEEESSNIIRVKL